MSSSLECNTPFCLAISQRQRKVWWRRDSVLTSLLLLARHSLFKAHIGGGEYTVQTRPLSIEGALERISLSSCHRKFWGWCSQQSRTDNPGLRHFHTGAVVVVVVVFVQMAGDGGRNLWKQYNNTDELSADRPLNLKSFKENVSFWLTF